MNICFRVDASINIGSGHVMRCLTLAKELKKSDHNVVFVSRLHEGHLCGLISSQGFEVIKLEKPKDYKTGALKHSYFLGLTQYDDIKETKGLICEKDYIFDWIIIDHYAIDKSWEHEIRKNIPNIMVIDDLADREHDCDILLDQNYFQNANTRYKQLVPNSCKLLLGPKYALLRDEFIEYHNLSMEQKDRNEVLLFYGGSDPTNETIKAINAIKKINSTNIIVHVVVGISNPNANLIEEYCDGENFIFHYNIDYMAKLMYRVDFAICAGGSATWERYCIGTPAIVTAVAYNQIELCENIQHMGIDRYIGVSESVTEEIIINEVNAYLASKAYKQRIEKAKKTVDGKGKMRILEKINSIKIKDSIDF